MDKFNQFLVFLQEKLESYPKFDTWKHLEILTATCAKEIISNDANYKNWLVEYDEDAHRFPDVIITTDVGKFGIEVKSSKSKNWETLGGSINESTKVLGLDEIFILFGKNINNQINIKIKEFSKCVKSVAVTHSPRYLIDMDLEDGTDIFALLNTSYEDVCATKSPFDVFKQYFKDKAKKSNTKFWFLSDEESERASETFQDLELKFFKQLSSDEQRQLVCEAIVLYPQDLFGSKNSKYENSNLFFLSRNVVSNSMRDNFTAGGQVEYFGKIFPQKIQLLLDHENLKILRGLLTSEPTIEMKNVYGVDSIEIIRSSWNSEITLALMSTMLKGKDELTVNRLLQSILIK